MLKRALARRIRHVISAVVAAMVMLTMGAQAQADDMADVLQRANLMDGFLPLYWDAPKGKLYADISGVDDPFIYYSSLSQGVGSNDLGLDRGRLGDSQLVEFHRVGEKVLLNAINTKYTARSDNPRERAAVEEAFAASVIWGFEVAFDEDGKTLIELNAFAERDPIGLAARLKQTGEGTYKVDSSRSAIHAPRTKAFPDNTEVDAILTFVGSPSGKILSTVAPDAGAVTVHGHHSFVRLPDDGYEPLPMDPRSGFIDGGEDDIVYDYATPITEPVKTVYARRHRLERADPSAERSEAVEPIVYYVDPGAPEPIRSALIEGASWWNQAFEAAGFIDGFQVKLLPEGADPMDVRYNVIQWVHRSTRGWSYGMSIRDPRTQEILKGHVTLGSLRVRQDVLLAEGLLAPYADSDSSEAVEAMALARIRQLSAHEVGHTIGLNHNFAASTNDRASVMDYPHPFVTLQEDGSLDLSNAYDTDIGEWDKAAINWGYRDFPDGTDRQAAREDIIQATLASGLRYVADNHSRVSSRSGAGPAHPLGSLWDSGADPLDELDRLMALRSAALSGFSESVIKRGEPLATIEDVLVPAYLMHRFQVQAAATLIGGSDFNYALRGDGQVATTPVSAGRQARAIDALLDALAPETLMLAPELVALIPPRVPSSGSSRELFPRETGYVFDPLAAASVAGQLTMGQLLDAKRGARLNNQAMVDDGLPNYPDVLAGLIGRLWSGSAEAGVGAVQRRLQSVAVDTLMQVATNTSASVQVRAEAIDALSQIMQRAQRGLKSRDIAWRAHHRFIDGRIAAAMADKSLFDMKPLSPPPGSPI